ncbi:MAG: hypothetical protein JNM68_05580 [Dinghuibacter sp.]|nr:hypothetical protein [Dinghuibacter sp.]
MKTKLLFCLVVVITGLGLQAQDTAVAAQKKPVVINTTNGNSFAGFIVSETDEEVVIETKNMGRVAIPKYNIKSINRKQTGQLVRGEYWFDNPNATRYVIGPSAIPLRKGEGYYQNLMLVAHSASVGITRNISIGGGTELLTPITTGKAPAVYFFTLKSGFKVAPRLHVGGGLLYLNIGNNYYGTRNNHLGNVFGLVTYGSRNNNVTVGAGWGAQRSKQLNPHTNNAEMRSYISKYPTFTFSAMARPFKWLGVVTENWVFPVSNINYPVSGEPVRNFSRYEYVLSYGVRLMGERVALDLGLFNRREIAEYTVIGLPYIAFVVRFGDKK